MIKRYKKYLYTIFITVIIIAAIASYALYLQMNVNFHQVIPKKIYRSSYPNVQELNKIWQRYHIKSIINLSTANKPYEAKFSKQHNIAFKQIPFHAHGTATKNEIIYLINSMILSPKPLLIHCNQGADRTGMAAALAIITQKHNYQPLSWTSQMSYKYGVASPNSIGYHVFKPYITYIDSNKLYDDKKNFVYWLHKYYKPTTEPYGWFWIT